MEETPHLQSSTMDLTIVMITFQIQAHLHYIHITTSKWKASPVSLEIESWGVNTEEQTLDLILLQKKKFKREDRKAETEWLLE